MVERSLCMREAAGSNPAASKITFFYHHIICLLITSSSQVFLAIKRPREEQVRNGKKLCKCFFSTGLQPSLNNTLRRKDHFPQIFVLPIALQGLHNLCKQISFFLPYHGVWTGRI